MRSFTAFTIFSVLAFALALFHSMDGAAGDSLSCSGSVLCGSRVSQSSCDTAERQIVPGNVYRTGGNKGSTGTCSGNCGLFVSGTDCSLTGQQMINDFNALRSHGCQKCGVYTYSNGCQFKMDYVTGC